MSKWTGLIKKKETVFIILLIGLILLVIAVPTDKKNEDSQTGNLISNSDKTETLQEEYAKDLESRLEEILSTIKGVGKVEVMITIKDSGLSVVEKDESGQETTRGEENSSSWEEETIYQKTDKETYPYVVNTIRPQIQGVLVVAQGVNDPVIQQEIIKGIMALFGIESHKISIINME